MKLISIVKQLQSQGVDIKYRIRKDGGILITQVSGLRFSGAEGNRYVRALTGQQLSEAQLKQRKSIRPPKQSTVGKPRKPPVSTDVKNKIKRLQAMYRKDKKKGKPTIANYRYVSERYGEAEAQRLLLQSEYYIKGIAYTENIEALVMRLKQLAISVSANNADGSSIDDLAQATLNYARDHRDKFTEDKLKWLLACIYDFESAWNANAQGTSSGIADSQLLISNFVSNYMATLNS